MILVILSLSAGNRGSKCNSIAYEKQIGNESYNPIVFFDSPDSDKYIY